MDLKNRFKSKTNCENTAKIWRIFEEISDLPPGHRTYVERTIVHTNYSVVHGFSHHNTSLIIYFANGFKRKIPAM